MDSVPETDHYQLDGGSLLYRLAWDVGDTYESIANAYASFATGNCDAAIMMDVIGHRPRITLTSAACKRNEMHRTVDVEAERLFTGTHDQFLNTTPNKEALIRLISDKLCQNGCKFVPASGDADIDIVEAAVSPSFTKSTTLMEDTDILVFLLFHSQRVQNRLYFRSDKSKDTHCIISMF